MRRKTIVSAISRLLGAAALFVLASCGSTNSGPSVATFKTVFITPSIATALTDVKLFSGGTCTDNVISGTVTITTTPLSVDLMSVIYNGLTASTAQPVTVTSYSVNFNPTDGGPALKPIQGGLGVVVPAGGSATASVAIVDFTNVATLQADPVLSQCSTPHSFHYIATITFFGTELGGTNATFSTQTDVTFNNSI